MTDLIIIAVVAVIVIAASRYIYKAKKRGARCIGCSVEGGCSCGCQGGCGCGEEK